MPTGGAEPVPVETSPTDDFDATRSGGQADEPGPGPVTVDGDLEGGCDHLVARLRHGHGDQRFGQPNAGIGGAGAPQDAGRGAGGQGHGGAVGGGGQVGGLQGNSAGAGDGEHGDDGATVAHRYRQSLETDGRIRPADRPARGMGFLSGFDHGLLRRPNCHDRGQLPL
jgi:hypothetical protein